MKCEIFFNSYCALDRHERLPVRLKIHLMHCRKCKQIIEKMQHIQTVQLRMVNSPMTNGSRLVEATMHKVYRLQRQSPVCPTRQKETPSFLSWLIAGIILILGFIIVPFSYIGKTGFQQFGSAFSIPFALLCAGSIVAYSAVFIAKNIVFFTDKFDI